MVAKINNISYTARKAPSFKNNKIKDKNFDRTDSDKTRDTTNALDCVAMLSAAAIAAFLANKSNKNFDKLQDSIYLPALVATMSGFALYEGCLEYKKAKNTKEKEKASLYTTIGTGGLVGIASGIAVNIIKKTPYKFNRIERYGEIGFFIPIAFYIIKEGISGIKKFIDKKGNLDVPNTTN